MIATLRDAATRVATMLDENKDALGFRYVSPYGNIDPKPERIPAIIVRAARATYDNNVYGYNDVEVTQAIDVIALYIASEAERPGQNVERAYAKYATLRQYLLENRKFAVEADGDNPITKYTALLLSDSGITAQTWPNAGTSYIATIFNLEVKYTIKVDYI